MESRRAEKEIETRSIKIEENNKKIWKGFESVRNIIKKNWQEIANTIDQSLLEQHEKDSINEMIDWLNTCKIGDRSYESTEDIKLIMSCMAVMTNATAGLKHKIIDHKKKIEDILRKSQEINLNKNTSEETKDIIMTDTNQWHELRNIENQLHGNEINPKHTKNLENKLNYGIVSRRFTKFELDKAGKFVKTWETTIQIDHKNYDEHHYHKKSYNRKYRNNQIYKHYRGYQGYSYNHYHRFNNGHQQRYSGHHKPQYNHYITHEEYNNEQDMVADYKANNLSR